MQLGWEHMSLRTPGSAILSCSKGKSVQVLFNGIEAVFGTDFDNSEIASSVAAMSIPTISTASLEPSGLALVVFPTEECVNFALNIVSGHCMIHGQFLATSAYPL